MPTLSMFDGVLVSMYLMDTSEDNSPHIHVRYQDFRAVYGIPEGNLLAGELPLKKKNLVEAWIEIHADELMADWQLPLKARNSSGLILCGRSAK